MGLPWVRLDTQWPRTLPFTDLQQWAVEAEQVGVWTRRRGEVFPLPEFPDDHLAEIRYQVEQDRKPPYWWRCDVAPDDVHLDHIKPWSKGGEHRVRNLQVTHSLCNMRKAARWDGGV